MYHVDVLDNPAGVECPRVRAYVGSVKATWQRESEQSGALAGALHEKFRVLATNHSVAWLRKLNHFTQENKRYLDECHAPKSLKVTHLLRQTHHHAAILQIIISGGYGCMTMPKVAKVTWQTNALAPSPHTQLPPAQVYTHSPILRRTVCHQL